MEENIEKDIKIGDIVELKSKHIGTIININEFREPSMKYGIDIKGFNDIAFLGEEAILRKIEKQNNIDEDIEKVRNFINHIRFEEPAQYSLQEWFLALESIWEKVEALKIELITKEEHEKLKWERDYYKLRFEELNKQWERVRIKLLGENYYNDGCDWKTCDEFMADDLIYKYKKRWWQFWRKV